MLAPETWISGVLVRSLASPVIWQGVEMLLEINIGDRRASFRTPEHKRTYIYTRTAVLQESEVAHLLSGSMTF